MFTNDDVFKRIGDLSGGEKGRVSLAKLMISKANFLILDEPTNHLDIISKEILEDALNRYTGTVLFVSHDRYFINKTATRILDLTQKTIVQYIGNYDYYLEKHDTLMQTLKHSADIPAKEGKNESQKEEWMQKKAKQANERKRAAKLKKAEDAIAENEKRLEELNEALNDEEIATNSARLSEIHNETVLVSEQLDKLYELWEKLASDSES